MEVRDLGEWIILAGGVVGAVALISGLAARGLRRMIREEVGKPVKETAKSLETSNGKSAGEFIEESAHTLEKVKTEISELRGELRVTNNLALQTNVLSMENSHRIDRNDQRIDDLVNRIRGRQQE